MLTCDRPTGIPVGEPPMPCCQTVQPDVPTGLPKQRLTWPKLRKSEPKLPLSPEYAHTARLPALRKSLVKEPPGVVPVRYRVRLREPPARTAGVPLEEPP